jgi:hypothetical protein
MNKNTKKLIKKTKKFNKETKKTMKLKRINKNNKKTKKMNGGGARIDAFKKGVSNKITALDIKQQLLRKTVANKIKAAPGAALRGLKSAPGAVVDAIKPGARASAVVGAVGDTGRSAIKGILTMENPIVYAYQLIERNVFGWDTIEQDRKMGKTAKSIFGDSLKEKNKGFTAMQLLKGKSFLPGGKNFVPPPTPPKL